MPNPFESPAAQNETNALSPQREAGWPIGPALTTGIALYVTRAILVFAYGMIFGTDTIGGPRLDAGGMVWIPFFVADFPWSFEFERYAFVSGMVALWVYALVVGVPWITYGFVLASLIRWVFVKCTGS